MPSESLEDEPFKATVSPSVKVWFSPALAIGATFAIIFISTVSLFVSLLLSVTVSISVCFPTVKSDLENDSLVERVVSPSFHI